MQRLQLSGLFSAALFLLALGSATGTALAFFGAHHWFIDLFTHFRVQYFWALLILCAWHFFRRQRLLVAAFFLLAVVNAAFILPFYFNKPAPLNHEGEPLSAMLLNVNRAHGKPQKVIASIRHHNPDFVVLEEIDALWVATLAPELDETYPHRVVAARDDNFGIGLWSKHPFDSAARHYSGDYAIPSIIAELKMPRGSVVVLATHPLPPVGAANAAARNEQLAEFARRAGMTDCPLLLIGDLNATPRCAAFRDLLRVSGLQLASQGRGIFPTWPAFFPAVLRIPLDHVLHTPDIEIVSYKTGARVGSDHLPVVVGFKLPPNQKR